jgi:membrane protein DedA with SNARE-associated domain
VLVASTVGGGTASLVTYLVGLWFGEENLRRLVGRFGRFLFVEESDLDRAGKMFEQHGGKAVLIGHLVRGVTALISVLAGLKRVPISGRFLFYTFLGTALWNGALIGLEWVLGAEWTLVKQYAPIVVYAVLATVVGGSACSCGAGGVRANAPGARRACTIGICATRDGTRVATRVDQ